MELNGIEKTLSTLTTRWFTDNFINHNKDIVKRERERTELLFKPLRLEHDNNLKDMKRNAKKESNQKRKKEPFIYTYK